MGRSRSSKSQRRGKRDDIPTEFKLLAAWYDLWCREVDARLYGLFRMTFAAAALINLIDLWPHRHTLLSSAGMIDRQTLLDSIGDDPYWSVFFWFDSPAEVTAITALAAVAIVLLGLGVAPRIAAAGVYVWHVSYSHAAFPALVGWDNLLRVYSLLVLISPLGLCWSLPSWLRNGLEKSEEREMTPQYGLVLMRWQLVVIYAATVWCKLDDPYWRNGELMAYFQMSIYSRFPSPVWADLPLLTCLMTYTALAIEMALPIMLCIRKAWPWALLLGLTLHLGIAATSNLAIFSWCILAVYAVFLETQALDTLGAFVSRTLTGIGRRVMRLAGTR